MTQSEIWDFLKANPDQWFTSKQLQEKLGHSKRRINRCLCRLGDDIDRRSYYNFEIKHHIKEVRFPKENEEEGS